VKFLFFLFIFFYSCSISFAQVQIPSAAESGISIKSLQKSQSRLLVAPKTETGQIIIKDSRKLIDPGEGPSYLVKKVEIEGNTLFDDKTLAPIIDIGGEMSMTLGIMSLIANEITAFYSKEGYFLAEAYIPQQELKSGVVKIKINEGQLGKIILTGNEKAKTDDILKRLTAIKEQPILKEQTLERPLLELNDITGVGATAVLKPGEKVGTTDLVVEIKETPPYTFSFDVDNFGSRFTGINRMGVSATWDSALTLGDKFFFRGVKSDKDQDLAQFSYQFPLNDRGDRTLRFAYTFSEQSLGDNLIPLNAGGRTNIFNAELAQVLYRTRESQFKVRFGFDLKNFKNFQLGQDTSRDHIRDFYVGLGGNVGDSLLGKTYYDFQLQRGFSGTSQKSALPSRSDGDAQLTSLQANLTRFQGTKLWNSYFILKANGQLVDDRALSPDLFAIGGYGSVRGFPLAEQSGDFGYNLAAEYVLPFPSKYPVGIENLNVNQIFFLTAFLEHGKVFVRDRQVGELDESITGGGFGLQINIPRNGICCGPDYRPPLNFALSYGVPLSGPSPTDASSGIVYASGSIGFF
jgi:hemolysin activation/secretion protein